MQRLGEILAPPSPPWPSSHHSSILSKLTMTANAPDSDRPSLTMLIWRGLRLRCPACGEGKMFRNWLTMRDPCEACGRKFNRAPGYLLGSIYFNYGATATLVVLMYFGFYLSGILTGKALLVLLTVFSLLFPLWFFRYARGLWIAFDELFDPWPNEQEVRVLDKEKADNPATE